MCDHPQRFLQANPKKHDFVRAEDEGYCPADYSFAADLPVFGFETVARAFNGFCLQLVSFLSNYQ